MRRTIRYGVTPEGRMISRVGSEIAWPILKWDETDPSSNSEVVYRLEKLLVLDVVQEMLYVFWTTKIASDLKNYHRKFWGFKPLKGTNEKPARARNHTKRPTQRCSAATPPTKRVHRAMA